MKVLAIATLYPDRSQPVNGVFVEQRVLALAARVPVRVICPVPWFPGAAWLPRYRYRRFVPKRETRGGVEVLYPRFLSVPGLLKPLDGWFVYLACLRTARRLRRTFPFDRIEAHFAFPDGWGALRLGRRFGVPVAVTLRGHDVNDLPRYPVRGRQVAQVVRDADVVFAVAEALREAALELGAPPERVLTVANGVDPDRFAPIDRLEARCRLGLPANAPMILSVGHLVERKGFHHIVHALPFVRREIPDARLVIIGAPGAEGDFSAGVRRAILEAGMAEHVQMVGAVPHDELAPWFSAADVFCLASAKEGRANVLLESLACGTPVVATGVWGTPEIVEDGRFGRLVDSTEPPVLGRCLVEALRQDWDRDAIAAHGRGFSWDAAAEAVERALQAIGRSDA